MKGRKALKSESRTPSLALITPNWSFFALR
jgi:hypothetical protein